MTAHARTPQFYPDTVTLSLDATAADILPFLDASAGCSVKDSFASLDLPGFEVLFSATWLHFPVLSSPGWPWLRHRTRPSSTSTARPSPTAVRPRSACGTSPATTGPRGRRRVPGLPIVGYEHGDELASALASGATPLGELRVWLATCQNGPHDA
ncbi:hypothetical protein AB0F91_13170 [Amycolatopsis sp. NPDC023774]|uniref:hypothetical protein n=1 Tax=Amycolatopsis sp. NPDC023774 TaxID=3155015 RepID=UPI0033EE6B10